MLEILTYILRNYEKVQLEANTEKEAEVITIS